METCLTATVSASYVRCRHSLPDLPRRPIVQMDSQMRVTFAVNGGVEAFYVIPLRLHRLDEKAVKS